MKNKYGLVIMVSLLAVLGGIGVAVRSFLQRNHFDRTVSEALKTSEGYDQKFIDMVNRLEDELALRASFGYSGQKDPMTGRERIVVRGPAPVRRRSAITKTQANAPAAPVVEAVDSVKLTAIINDDEKKSYTAIIMVGERSFAIEVGDYVVGHKITSITNERVIMEDERAWYSYDITGSKGRREKFTGGAGGGF